MDHATQDVQCQRYVAESDDILTAEQIVQLEESVPYKNGEKAFSLAKEGGQLTSREFIAAQDLLLVKITLSTGTRPAPLNNATLQDYYSARVEDGKKVMLVAKHKRSKDGPAIVALTPQIQELMEVFVRNIRPLRALPEEKNLFVKWDGSGYPEGTIGKRLSEFFEKANVRPAKRVAHTDVRKFIATSTHEKAPEQSSQVQRMMGHSRKTFEQWYVRQQCTKTGAEALDVIERVTAVDKKNTN